MINPKANGPANVPSSAPIVGRTTKAPAMAPPSEFKIPLIS